MKSLTLLSAAIATFVWAGPGVCPKSVAVSIRGFEFNPGEATLTVGDTVEWTNNDPFVHTAEADSGAWSSPEIERGGRYLFVAKRPGRYTYHCAAHPVMHGVLVVR